MCIHLATAHKTNTQKQGKEERAGLMKRMHEKEDKYIFRAYKWMKTEQLDEKT